MIERVIRITDTSISVIFAVLKNLPLDGSLEIVIRDHKDVRTSTQNARIWAACYADIAAQAWVSGRQFDAKTWHEHCKQEFLPEESDPELKRMVIKPESYKKWQLLPNGAMTCIASTTRLTKYGAGIYMEKVTAMGGELGVMFSSINGD